jgi:hypothetical protein
MEADMAHLTLQLGAAVVIPIRAPRKMASGRTHWRVRALSEAAVAAAAPLGFNWSASHMGSPRCIGPVLARAAARGARSEA